MTRTRPTQKRRRGAEIWLCNKRPTCTFTRLQRISPRARLKRVRENELTGRFAMQAVAEEVRRLFMDEVLMEHAWTYVAYWEGGAIADPQHKLSASSCVFSPPPLCH